MNNPTTIYQSIKTGEVYPIHENGKEINTDVVINPDMTKYKKVGKNNVFVVYELKKSAK